MPNPARDGHDFIILPYIYSTVKHFEYREQNYCIPAHIPTNTSIAVCALYIGAELISSFFANVDDRTVALTLLR